MTDKDKLYEKLLLKLGFWDSDLRRYGIEKGYLKKEDFYDFLKDLYAMETPPRSGNSDQEFFYRVCWAYSKWEYSNIENKKMEYGIEAIFLCGKFEERLEQEESVKAELSGKRASYASKKYEMERKAVHHWWSINRDKFKSDSEAIEAIIKCDDGRKVSVEYSTVKTWFIRFNEDVFLDEFYDQFKKIIDEGEAFVVCDKEKIYILTIEFLEKICPQKTLQDKVRILKKRKWIYFFKGEIEQKKLRKTYLLKLPI